MNSIGSKLLFVDESNCYDIVKFNEKRIKNETSLRRQDLKPLLEVLAKVHAAACPILLAGAFVFAAPTLLPAAVVVATVSVIAAIAYGVLHIRDLRYQYAKEMCEKVEAQAKQVLLDALEIKDLSRYPKRLATSIGSTEYMDNVSPSEFPKNYNFLWGIDECERPHFSFKLVEGDNVRVLTIFQRYVSNPLWAAGCNNIDPSGGRSPGLPDSMPSVVVCDGHIDPVWKQFLKEHIPQPYNPA